MNEKHMGEIERQLLQVSRSRKRLREAAAELKLDDAEEHLVTALLAADSEMEKVYKKLFQSTYFHVPEAEPKVRKRRSEQDQDELDEQSRQAPDPPIHTQESLLP